MSLVILTKHAYFIQSNLQSIQDIHVFSGNRIHDDASTLLFLLNYRYTFWVDYIAEYN